MDRFVAVIRMRHSTQVFCFEVAAADADDALDRALTHLFDDDYEPGSLHHRDAADVLVVAGTVAVGHGKSFDARRRITLPG